MKKVLLILVMLNLFQHLGVAQPSISTFSKVFKDNYLYAKISLSDFVLTTDSGFLAVGNHWGGTGNNISGLILKLDASGNKSWNKTFSNTLTTPPKVYFTKVVPTFDSCFIITGSNFSHQPPANDNTAFCMKINQQGDFLWARSISHDTLSLLSSDIEETADSGFVVVGTAANQIQPSHSRIFIAKFKKDASLEWSSILSRGNSIYPYSVKQTFDNGYLLTGASDNIAILIKLDSDGNFLWGKKYFDGYSASYAGSIEIMQNGMLINMLYKSTYDSIVVMKTDFSGDVMWAKSYFRNTLWNGSQSKLYKTSDNNYVFAQSDGYWGTAVLKIDSSGNLLWTRDFIIEEANIVEVNDNGLIMIGNGVYSNSQGDEIGIIKTDTTGICLNGFWGFVVSDKQILSDTIFPIHEGICLVSDFFPTTDSTNIIQYETCLSYSPWSVNENSTTNNFMVYPNPASSSIVINGEWAINNGQLKIMNTQGQLVYQCAMGNEQLTIDISALSKGIYFLSLTDGEQTVNRKFVKE